jgi:thiol-disulfide isomerase/thioredoxin
MMREKFQNLLLALLITAMGSLSEAQGQVDPEIQALMKKGYEAFSARKYQEAEKAFKEANKRGHNSCQPCLLALVSTYARLGNGHAAMDMCNRAIEVSTDDQQRARAHMMKSDLIFVMDGKQKLKESESEIRTALQLDPKNPIYHYNLGRALMRESLDAEGKHELESYIQMAPEGSQVADAKQFIANPRRAREQYAPDFTATGLHNENIHLGEYAGKVVVLDFWATWCHPCVQSVPELKDLLKKYPSEKLVLVSVSADVNEDTWRNFIEDKKMNWLQIFDKNHQLRDSFGVNAFPTYLVIDGEGIIQDKIVGTDPSQTVAYRLKDKLKKMLESKSN